MNSVISLLWSWEPGGFGGLGSGIPAAEHAVSLMQPEGLCEPSDVGQWASEADTDCQPL